MVMKMITNMRLGVLSLSPYIHIYIYTIAVAITINGELWNSGGTRVTKGQQNTTTTESSTSHPSASINLATYGGFLLRGGRLLSLCWALSSKAGADVLVGESDASKLISNTYSIVNTYKYNCFYHL
jgi:hypothetical protein